jgi:hypothetical protein
MSLMDFITGMGIYGVSLLFFFVSVAPASLQYHIALTKSDTETIEKFIASLSFPLTIFRYYPYENLNDYQKVSTLTATIGRLIGLFFTAIALVLLCYQLGHAAERENTSLVLLYVFWIAVYFVTLFYSLRFGQKLKQLI